MIARLKRLMRGESNIDFIGRSKLWAIISLSVVAIATIALTTRELNLGLEFKGGSSLTVTLEREVTIEQVEEAVRDELPDAEVQIGTRSDGRRETLVRTRETGDEELRAAATDLARLAGQLDASGQPDIDEVSRKVVGPSWGRQVSQKALRGLIVFLVLVSIYISMRFEPKMAAGALTALFHDLLATAGIYAIVGFEVTPATVIALLTLMGFSLYDTVVVFDRVRENSETFATTKSTYSQMVNRSMNEVLVRSINTSLSSLLPVAGLLFVGVFLFGAVTLKDLALAMFVGTAVSTYSSIFVAAPVLAFLKEREPKNRALRARAEREETRAAAPPRPPVVGTVAPGDGDGDEDEHEPVGAPVRVRGGEPLRAPRHPGASRGGPRQRGRKRGKRR